MAKSIRRYPSRQERFIKATEILLLDSLFGDSDFVKTKT
jgi:hypothetical protein